MNLDNMPAEDFFVRLSNETNAVIMDNEGRGEILNDDGAPPPPPPPPCARMVPVLEWHPSSSEVPVADYDALFVPGDEVFGWHTSVDFFSRLDHVLIAPIDHPVPYEFDIEYGGDVDTFCDHDTVNLDFFSPGKYTVKYVFEDPATPDVIRMYYVDSEIQAHGGAKPGQQAGVAGVIPVAEIPRTAPVNGLIISQTGFFGTAGIANAYFQGEVQVNSLDEAIRAIDNRYAALNPGARRNRDGSVRTVPNGVRVDVIANFHGIFDPAGDPFPEGGFAIGQDALSPNRTVVSGPQQVRGDANLRLFIAALRGKVSSIRIVGCAVASNLNPAQPNDHIMERLASGLSIQGMDVTISGWATNIWVHNKSFFGRDNYWSKEDQDAPLISLTR